MTTKQSDPFAGIEPVDVITTGPADRAGVQDVPQSAAAFATVSGKVTGTGKDSDVRTAHQARVWAFSQVKSNARGYLALCLMFVRLCFGLDPLEPDAKAAWQGAAKKHRTSDATKIPNAKPVFWEVGDHWHVAFSIGGGKCVSTDIRRAGGVNVCRIDAISEAWGATLLGWTDDLNGEAVPAKKARRRINDRAWRVRMLRASIERAQHEHESRRVMRLRKWLREVRSSH